MTTIRNYRDLRPLKTIEERFEYLQLGGQVGRSTFGFDRYINQNFYRSREWKQLRSFVVARDQGCDLGIPGHEIYGRLLVHHMNPLTVDDIDRGGDILTNPDYLITTTHGTHNAIHYGDARLLPKTYVPRRRGDTKLW
jgi:hypothetical protein